MTSGHNRKGRSKRTPGGYVRLHRYVMRCNAWRALSPHAKCLYLVLLDRHRDFGQGKNNNGKIALSHREAMSETGCSDRGIRKGFRDLIAKGFIRITRDSAFNIKVALAREYAITEYPLSDSLATKDFMRWTPDEEKNAVSNVNTVSPKTGRTNCAICLSRCPLWTPITETTVVTVDTLLITMGIAQHKPSSVGGWSHDRARPPAR